MQPFLNPLIIQTLTGAPFKDVLEQQSVGFGGQTAPRFLQVSAGLTYSRSESSPAGARISNIAINGVPVDPLASYRVTATSFLANGSNGFTTLTLGTDRVAASGSDLDALVGYLGAFSPVSPPPANRITRIP